MTDKILPGGFQSILYRLRLKFILGIAVMLIADWLLLGHMPGIALAVFILFLGSICAGVHLGKVGALHILKGLIILILSQLPIIEQLSKLNLFISVFGAAFFLLYIRGTNSTNLARSFWTMVVTFVSAPYHLFKDTKLMLVLNNRLRSSFGKPNIILLWVLPVLFTLVFVYLFMLANPIFRDILTNFDSEISFNISLFTQERIVFWLLMIAAIWPFITIRQKYSTSKKANYDFQRQAYDTQSSSLADIIFNKHTVLRSLVLFNLVFALQTFLDLTYLWAGFELPKGMNYADYAHRGAYPLVATALLAAGFVLVALRTNSETSKSALIRALVYLWVGQNIMLVLSAILRLNLYVEIYYLTHLRVAAFIWMGLVACGLCFILLRILFRRDNIWLINVNMVVLIVVLYGYSLSNVNYFIANYNLTHVGKGNEKQASLDTYYLCVLGMQAIPAIDKYLKNSEGASVHSSGKWNISPSSRESSAGYTLKGCREQSLKRLEHRLSNWRSWNFSSWRLDRYIQRQKSANPVSTDGPSLNKEQ